jgi:sugar phosphate isomerase/epimerase
MKTRREFLQTLSLVSGGIMVSNSVSGAGRSRLKKETGIQLWTLRDAIDTDLNGTLTALGKMGYTSIETFGFDGNFYGRPAAEFRDFCAAQGISIHSTHTGITASNAASYAENAAKAGLEFLVLPSMMGRPESTLDDFKRLAEEMNQIGKSCLEHGIRFGYHNHGFEFKAIDGQLPYDILLNNTDPKLVSFQLDIFWIIKGGQNPVDYFEKHPGRFTSWHMKDMGRDGESCIVGNGSIDFKSLLKHAKTAGLERIFVEQEAYSEGSPIYCAGQSLKYIQSHLL